MNIEVVTAIVGITVIEITAILCGINGVLASLTIAAISGLGGYELSKVIKK